MLPIASSCRVVLLFAALALALPAAARADVLVIDSAGPSAADYPRGTRLADDAEISLKQGDGLLLLDGGGTRVLRGPLTMRLDAPHPRAQERAEGIARSLRNTQRSRAGAVRGPVPAPGGGTLYENEKPRTMWFVDIGQGGTVCLAEGARVTLWRKRGGREQRLRLDPIEGGESRLVYFPSDTNEVAWSSAMADGIKAWQLTQDPADGETEPVKIYLTEVDIESDDPISLATVLLDNGCDVQLEYAAEKLRNPQYGVVLPSPGGDAIQLVHRERETAPAAM
ncbi:MAG: hypothetical protein AAFX04_10325 [Pseudomonadota bacterium]